MSRNTKPPMPNQIDRIERPGTRPYATHGKNEDAVAHGVPRWLRRYCKRYGAGVDALLAMHKKNLELNQRKSV